MSGALKLVPPRKGKSPNWRIRGTYLGQYVDQSTGSPRRKIAEACRRKVEREIEDGLYGKSRLTFADAVTSYVSECPDSQIPYVTRLLEYFGDRPLIEIDQQAIDACARALLPGRAPSTMNRNVIGPLAAVLHNAAKSGMCPWIRVERKKEPKGRVRWLEPHEAEALINAAGDRLRPLIIFLFSTGARLGEAIRLTWRDVNLARKHGVLRDTKNGETYGVFVADRILAELKKLPHREGIVFGYANRWEVYKEWRAACKGAGIDDFTPHDCRHTYATWLRQSGQDLKALMELGRWKDLKSVVRYSHVSSEEQKEAIRGLPINRSPGSRGAGGKTKRK